MTALASVKVAREKLLELLHEAKEAALAEFEERVRRYDKDVAERRAAVVAAAKRDLSKDENFTALRDAVQAYHSRVRNKQYDGQIGDNERKRIGERYDSAIKLVEISSDDEFKVNSNTEFGYLLGL